MMTRMTRDQLNVSTEALNYHNEKNKSKCTNFLRPRIKCLLFLIICFFLIIISLISFRHKQSETEIHNSEIDYSPLFQDQCNIIPSKRFDCYPRGHTSQEICNRIGCCWLPSEESNVPRCFYPESYNSYKYINVTEHSGGMTAFMELMRSSLYPNDVKLLRLDVNYVSESQVNVKIFDPLHIRYEPPYPILNIPDGPNPANLLYKVNIDEDNSGFQVIRKSNNEIVFDAQGVGGFVFADQFLQISALLPSNYIYGLGHQRNEFLLNLDWNVITLFNHDLPPTDKKYIDTDKTNFYSSHPFYLSMENSSLSHGVLLLNSNAMDIILQQAPAITFRPIGGILDFYFFLGPSPTEVIQEYTALIGRPYMPPYWSLGFHLSRLGYTSVNETQEVLNNNRKVGIPVDTQWNDLDYMNKRNDFTYDRNPSTYAKLNEFVEYLHHNEMHYVILIDPGISAGEEPGSYPPYDQGLPEELFILDHSGKKPFLCRVWNRSNKTVFPDFTHPKANEYWKNQIELQYTQQFQFDGIWLDMNEPTNFINGSFNGCANGSYEHPPYLPRVDGDLLSFHTVCMSARHHSGIHYNLHNIYGLMQTIATTEALESITQKRAFVITRATFPGIGHYSGTWTGDVSSTWDDMKYSVADILSFNLFGLPFVGADICGFNYNTTVPLCQRWSQLGAFYPFSRNHNSDDNVVQDPYALGKDVIISAKKALQIRYYLLPYLYTLFWLANISGNTVARPIFFEFPDDKNTYSQYQQFLWGPALLIAPVLVEKETSVTFYLPKGVWYDYYTHQQIKSNGSHETLPAPLDNIPLLFRGGYIIPTQSPASTTVACRRNKMGVIVSLDEYGSAVGTLFWDDGESLNTYEKNMYNHIELKASNNTLVSTIVQWNFYNQPPLGSIILIGLKEGVKKVTINSQIVEDFLYNISTKTLRLDNLAFSFQHQLILNWSN